RTLVEQIRKDGFLRKPILVAAGPLVILDGHHRVEALRILGCTRIPVYLLDYDDPAVGITTWPDAIVKAVTKAEVIDRGTHGDLFPPKTTRHTVVLEIEEVRIPLEDLR
ncbi:MAG TPA: ParB N-terminal domain-containing protein, partial [Thermoplasmata archaeon]|nr:ParB N-terminal domain-containing protein [Thermoplasmata archaeon]